MSEKPKEQEILSRAMNLMMKGCSKRLAVSIATAEIQEGGKADMKQEEKLMDSKKSSMKSMKKESKKDMKDGY